MFQNFQEGNLVSIWCENGTIRIARDIIVVITGERQRCASIRISLKKRADYAIVEWVVAVNRDA